MPTFMLTHGNLYFFVILYIIVTFNHLISKVHFNFEKITKLDSVVFYNIIAKNPFQYDCKANLLVFGVFLRNIHWRFYKRRSWGVWKLCISYENTFQSVEIHGYCRESNPRKSK